MMKWIGAMFIVVGCGGVGLAMCQNHRRLENAMQSMIASLEWMVRELHYRMPPLSALCRGAGEVGDGAVGDVFTRLAAELERQILPDAAACTHAALAAVPQISPLAEKHFRTLAMSLGKFDLQGQIGVLETEIASCRRDLEELTRNRGLRLRNYRSLALCAGIALAILLL